jgi:hypothetical protein
VAERKKSVRTRRVKTEPEAIKVETEIKKSNLDTEVKFSFTGEEGLKAFQPDYFDELKGLVKQFQSRFGVRMQYIPKFKAFKLFRDGKHVDWIELNDLTKRYDCRMPPVKMALKPQRPYNDNRVY